MLEVSQSCSTLKLYQLTADIEKSRNNCYCRKVSPACINDFRLKGNSIVQTNTSDLIVSDMMNNILPYFEKCSMQGKKLPLYEIVF